MGAKRTNLGEGILLSQLHSAQFFNPLIAAWNRNSVNKQPLKPETHDDLSTYHLLSILKGKITSNPLTQPLALSLSSSLPYFLTITSCHDGSWQVSQPSSALAFC